MSERTKPCGEHSEGFFFSQQPEIHFWWDLNSGPVRSTTLPDRASHLNRPAFRGASVLNVGNGIDLPRDPPMPIMHHILPSILFCGRQRDENSNWNLSNQGWWWRLGRWCIISSCILQILLPVRAKALVCTTSFSQLDMYVWFNMHLNTSWNIIPSLLERTLFGLKWTKIKINVTRIPDRKS